MGIKKTKGAVLLMTMMAMCLTFMMVYVLVQTTGIGLYNTSSFYDRETALQAAQSGLDYAVTRLQSNYGWRGDSNCKYWNGTDETADKSYGSLTNGFLVGESNGNVVGIIRGKTDTISAFRIKFSYEDNSDATYSRVVRSRFGLANTSDYMPRYEIQSPYVSVNNLLGANTAPIYRSKDSGKGVNLDTSTLENSSVDGEESAVVCHVLPQRVYLVVEGITGKGLRDCTTLVEANNIANSGNNVTKRYIEAFYNSNANIYNGDAALASGNLSFHVNDKVFASTYMRKLTSDVSQLDDPCNVPVSGSLRSDNGIISVLGGKLNTYNGKLVHKDGIRSVFTQDTDKYKFINADGNEQEYQFLQNSEETIASDVEKIEWDNVAKASAQGDTLAAGFYQWYRTPDSTERDPRYYLRYYPDGYVLDDKDRPIPKNTANFKVAVVGSPTDAVGTVKIGGKDVEKILMGSDKKIKFSYDETGKILEPTITVRGNLYCPGTFALGSNVSEINKCPKFQLYPTEKTDISPSVEEGVITADGNIYIASALYGSGAIVTQKDVTFMGGSVLESGSCGVAIYGRNVTLKSLEGAMMSAPSGKTLDKNVLEENSVTENQILNFGPDGLGPDFIAMLEQSWHDNGCYTPDPQDVRDYFKEKFNIEADVRGMTSAPGHVIYDIPVDPDKRVYIFPIIFKGPCGNVTYKFTCPNWEAGCEVKHNNCLVPNVEVPREAFFPTKVKIDLSPVQKKQVDMFGTMCYGDQVFSGVIYAKNNFVVDLGNKYNLMVTGAVRAENGDIDVTCKGADIAYDESYMRKLLPNYSRLNCKLWNCW